ncbi:MAG: 5'-nucleotidase C-terminal domain-containing protein [Shewanellaceae bacterium]|nr:5'-nucleotidase C-terminal domain-containing protein [Shewanellaceae bacterium]
MKAEHHHASIQVNSNCLPDKVNGTWIMQAQDWGKYVGRADFVYAQGQLKLTRYQLIDVNLKDSIQPRIKPDLEVKTFLTPYYEAAQAESQNVVAYLDRDLPGQRSRVRSQQTALGALVGDAVNNVLDVDFTITNSGTIRDSLAAGVITNKDLLRVFPFKNKMIKINTTGAELMHYLALVAQIPAGTGAFPQFYGIILPYHLPLRPEEILIQGNPLDVNRIYSFGVSDFMAYGGDGYPYVMENAAYEVDEMDFYHRHVLERFFEAQSDLVLLPYFEYAKQQTLMARTSLE